LSSAEIDLLRAWNQCGGADGGRRQLTSELVCVCWSLTEKSRNSESCFPRFVPGTGPVIIPTAPLRRTRRGVFPRGAD
jgi:hypothetical protein